MKNKFKLTVYFETDEEGDTKDMGPRLQGIRVKRQDNKKEK